MLRFFSFFPSVINHDESTYIVISDTLLAGYTYQVDYIDTKPVGIFLLYALLQLLLGKSIILLRIAAAATLAATAFFLYQAKRSFGSRPEAAFAAGMMYLFLNSIFTYYGVSPNTETYFNLFTALSLWIYFSRPALWGYFIAGLSLGIGFVIKYVVLFDGMALGLFLLWQARQGKERWELAWSKAIIMATGASLPFLATIAYYQCIGHLEEFWFYTFTVSSRYIESQDWLSHVTYSLDFILRFLPVSVFFFYALFSGKAHFPSRRFGMLWAFLVLLGVLLPGKFFGHYFIQFMLPFCFLAGEFFGIAQAQLPKGLRWLRQPKIGYSLLSLIIITNLFLQYKDYYLKQDIPRQIVDFLSPQLSPDDIIYTANDQITYHLLGKLPPLPYVHPSLFWEEQHLQALEISQKAEIEKLKAKEPRFLIFRNPENISRFAKLLEEKYQMAKKIDERVRIYERMR